MSVPEKEPEEKDVVGGNVDKARDMNWCYGLESCFLVNEAVI